MHMAQLSLLVPMLALNGCEAIGPNEIATWEIFHRDRAAIVYTTDPVGSIAAVEAEGSPGQVDSYTYRYPFDGTRLASLVTASSDPYNDVLQATPLGFEFIPDPDDLGPAPQFPVIDIAEISRSLETFDEGSAALSPGQISIHQPQANDW